MNVKIVKLSTGEDAICEVVNITTDSITIKNPMRLVPVGQGQLGIMPLVIGAEENKNIVINRNHVLFIVEAEQDIINNYNSKYGSGIVLPTGQLEFN